MARIIIADDDELIGEMARDALIAAGHGAGLVVNGADALHVIKTRRPDLVILDCNMPGLSGVLLVQELRKSPDFAGLPVMMLTRKDPLVPPALFRSRAFTVINVSTFLVYGALYTSSSYIE